MRKSDSRSPLSCLVLGLALLAPAAGGASAAETPDEPEATRAGADVPSGETEPAADPSSEKKPGFWRRMFGRASDSERKEDVRSARPSRDLALLQERLRASPLGQDATVLKYLDLVDRHEATGAVLNDFANFLARAGYLEEALAYYEVAIRENPRDATLLVNSGTVRRRLGRSSEAEAAFRKALRINPSNALAHYNLGTIFDERDDYDRAIEEYTKALALDPRLGDPTYNSQAVNNERLLVVKLELYKSRAGALDLPLQRLATEPSSRGATAAPKNGGEAAAAQKMP